MDEYVIWSFEHDAWWGPHAWGYTPDLKKAGRYGQTQADRIVAKANIVAVNEVAMLLSVAQAASLPRHPRLQPARRIRVGRLRH